MLNVDRHSWLAASDEVIETINRLLGAAGKRFDGLTLTNTKTYFTAHISGEGPRTRTDWCFWPMGEFFLTEIRDPRSSIWDSRLKNIQGLELLEYNKRNGGRYRLKVFPNCSEDAISAIVDLASEAFSRKAHLIPKERKDETKVPAPRQAAEAEAKVEAGPASRGGGLWRTLGKEILRSLGVSEKVEEEAMPPVKPGALAYLSAADQGNLHIRGTEGDPVGEKISKNLGPDWSVTKIYGDKEISVYHIWRHGTPKSACLIHFQDIAKDTGSTFTIGDDNPLRGKIGTSHLSLAEVEDAIGTIAFQRLKRLMEE